MEAFSTSQHCTNRGASQRAHCAPGPCRSLHESRVCLTLTLGKGRQIAHTKDWITYVSLQETKKKDGCKGLKDFLSWGSVSVQIVCPFSVCARCNVVRGGRCCRCDQNSISPFSQSHFLPSHIQAGRAHGSGSVCSCTLHTHPEASTHR